MKNKLYIFIFLLSACAFGQTIRDSVFNDVLLIENEDVTVLGNNYLINKPLHQNGEPSGRLVIFNNSRLLPNETFFKDPAFCRTGLILIAHDLKYYERIAAMNDSLHIRPARTYKFYDISTDNNGRIVIDSLSVTYTRKEPPVLNIKNRPNPTEYITIYAEECYGSRCCPHDPKWDYAETTDKQKKDFVKKEGIASYAAYHRIAGKEGEYCIAYPLSEFTNAQKLEFIILLNKAEALAYPGLATTHPKIYFPLYTSKPYIGKETVIKNER